MRSLFGFFILRSSSLAGLSGPVHRMITALIKDGLGLCKSQDSCEQGGELTEHAAIIHTVCTICLQSLLPWRRHTLVKQLNFTVLACVQMCVFHHGIPVENVSGFFHPEHRCSVRELVSLTHIRIYHNIFDQLETILQIC